MRFHTTVARDHRACVAACACRLRRHRSGGQSWPSGIIKIVVPFPPGGTVDPIARMAQPGLQQKLGATIVIENRPGSSGSLGTELVAKSPPDGNSWVFVFDSHAVNPFLFDLHFDTVKDLEPVMLIGTAPNVLATHPSRTYKTFADVVAAAKPKPDTITYASIGSGSVGHLTMTLLSERAGCKLVHVPYRGGGPAMNDAIAGHVDIIIGSAAFVVPQVNAKTIVPLLQTGKTRMPTLTSVPTAIESGFAGFNPTPGGAYSRLPRRRNPSSSVSRRRSPTACATHRQQNADRKPADHASPR